MLRPKKPQSIEDRLRFRSVIDASVRDGIVVLDAER